MPTYRIAEAANLLGISDDTMRRLAEIEGLNAHDGSGRRVIDGEDLARLAKQRANPVDDPSEVGRSARNRFVGLVTSIESDKVMSQVRRAVPWRPGARELLRYLADRKVPFAIATKPSVISHSTGAEPLSAWN